MKQAMTKLAQQMRMETISRKYLIGLFTSIMIICLIGLNSGVVLAQSNVVNEDDCYNLIHSNIDSTFILEEGNENYENLIDTLKLVFKVKIDSVGEVVCCQLVRNNDFIDNNFALKLCQALSKLNLLCLYRLNFGDHYKSNYKSYNIPYNKKYSKFWQRISNKTDKKKK
jgi:hypothetical protein